MFWSFNRTIIQTQTSKTTQKWVTEHKTKLLLSWPFQSSDLNPVEDESSDQNPVEDESSDQNPVEDESSDLNPVEDE